MTACAALSLAAPGAHAQAPTPTVAAPVTPTVGITLPGHVPALVGSSAPLGPVLGAQPMSLALTLPLRDPQGLEDTIHALYDAASPAHGRYLTPAQFTDRFGPTQADYDALARWAAAHGLTVTGTNPARTILDVSAPASTVQAALGVRLMRYSDPAGREFFAPAADPVVDLSMAGILSGVVGLDNANPARPAGGTVSPVTTPSGTGGGPGGSLTPQDIRSAYNLNGPTLNGAGQAIALFELNGFVQSDIQAYEAEYGLPDVYVPQVYVDGYGGGIVTGLKGQDIGQVEVTADVELAVALAPEAAKVIVYEARPPDPNNPADSDAQAIIDEYSRIANDDAAQQVSTSWGQPEGAAAADSYTSGNTSTPMSVAEYAIFAQMACQGQTVYAASGDNGAYDNGPGNPITVRDPASQPYVCGVGGTSLTTSGPSSGPGRGGGWVAETTWNALSSFYNIYQSGGGGISGNWQIPWYQDQPGVYSSGTNQGGSPVNRDVPDVALDAAYNQPYAIYETPKGQQGGPSDFYGTSAAAPLWAAFTALVNQQRHSNGLAPLGFVNPYVYQIGTGLLGNYAADFHDVTLGNNDDGTGSPYYPAGPGYDAATGWGSFNGLGLFSDLSTIAAPKPIRRPFYQVYSGGDDGYAYTTSLGVVRAEADSGYHFQGIACHVYGGASDASGLAPLYHVQNPTTGDNYYPNSVADEQNAQAHGYTNVDSGPACYVFPDGSTPGTVPLYGAFYLPTGQHYLTTSLSTYNGLTGPKWQQNGIRCWVLP